MSEKAIPDPGAVGWVQDPENTEFWTWKVTDELVEEAPDDGAQYGRESKTWTEIVMPEVPDETDPTVPEYVKAISTDDIANWSASYSWGDHGEAGYATEAWVLSKNYITASAIPASLWTDISAETGENTIERFGDEVWVTGFRDDDFFIGAKLGSDISCTGKVTSGNGTFVGLSFGLQFNSNNDIIPVDASGDAKVGIDLGTNSAKFMNGRFSGEVSATSFVGDGSGLTGMYTGADAVKTSGNQTVGGTKTFSSDVVLASGKYIKTQGSSGWMNTTHGGGWYMSDATWIRAYGSKAVYVANTGANAIAAAGDVVAYYSDERLKDVQGQIENPLDKVDAIDTFYYTHNDLAKSLGYEGDDVQVGVSAQSVKAVMPEVVCRAPVDMDADGGSLSGEDYMTVKYERLVPLLLESIKELRKEIEELKRG